MAGDDRPPGGVVDDTEGDAGSRIRVLGLVGSLRRGSLNRQLMEAARVLAPERMEITRHDLDDIPLYNGDRDNEAERPEAVARLKRAITEADALLIATPEYNHTVPGVLQNALDWASRPSMKSPLRGKAVGIMGAAPGAIGTARAQQHLKLVLVSTLAHVLPHPGVAVGRAAERFDASGRLIHPPTVEFVTAFLEDLESWARRMGPRSRAAAEAMATGAP